MATLRALILLVPITLLLPAAATADEPIPTGLREVHPVPAETPVSPSGAAVGVLVAEAANPRVPENIAQARFEEIVSRGPSAVPALTYIYKDPKRADLEVWVAARALGRVGGPEARAGLEAGLKSVRIMSRLGSVSGLGLMRDLQAIPALEGALYDKAMMVRAAAADALGGLAQPTSALALGKALNISANFRHGQSLFVRKHIVDALGAVGNSASIELLVTSVGDADPGVQISARKALVQMTGKSFGRSSKVSSDEAEAWQAWWQNEGRDGR
jgi:HEAT repeat protein